MRRTKILVTVGPAVDSPAHLARLARKVDGFRVNFSHGESLENRRKIAQIQVATKRARRTVAIVADLQGPKLRIGDVPGGSRPLVEGSQLTLRRGLEAGSSGEVPLELPVPFRSAAQPNDPVLLGDGQVTLRVKTVSSDAIVTQVTRGGLLGSRTGVFLPRARLRTSVLNDKDRQDLRLAVGSGVDYVALSFVQRGSDLRSVRAEVMRMRGESAPGLIAKIERAEALLHFDEILAAADGIMVARGDLGVEVPLERLALEQKDLLARTNAAGKFGIVATQMLLSMVREPRPTRAEATDVANAILDGADVLMLSEESAVGRFPHEAVAWLDRIARATEPHLDVGVFLERRNRLPLGPVESGMAEAATRLARTLDAAAIVAPTHSGRTARLVAALRPRSPIVAPTARPATGRRLALVWGVQPMRVPAHLPLERLRSWTIRYARSLPRKGRGRPIVLTAGYPVEGRPTNLLTVIDGER